MGVKVSQKEQVVYYCMVITKVKQLAHNNQIVIALSLQTFYMNTTPVRLSVFAVAITLLLSSCFTTYQVESAHKIDNNDAHFVLYRKGILGFAVGTKLYANGKFVGKVGANRYISCWLPEGEYLMSVRTSRADEVFFKVNLKAGKTNALYFSYSGPKVRNKSLMVHPMEDPTWVLNRRRPPVVNYFQ